MKFEALIAIVKEENEEQAIDIAKNAGAGGVTIVKGSAMGLEEKKIFFGLTLEENVSLLFFILPRKITMSVFKTLKKELKLENNKDGGGLVMTLPISHLTGIDVNELELFEDEVKDFL